MASEAGKSTEKETKEAPVSEVAESSGAETEVSSESAPETETAEEPVAEKPSTGDAEAAKPATAKPAAAKPAAANPGAARPAASRPGAPKAKTGAAKGGKAGTTGKRPATKRAGFPLRNVLLFGALVVVLLAAFGVLGSRDTGGPNNTPRWKLNEPVDVEITLVASDANDLNCAMEGEVGGLHCGFTAPGNAQPSAKSSREDDKLLQPYSTTNRQNFLAAGVWTQPDLKDAAALEAKIKSMQNPRFSVTCKFTPRGRAKSAKIQWKQGGEWNAAGDGWYVGDVKDCKLAK